MAQSKTPAAAGVGRGGPRLLHRLWKRKHLGVAEDVGDQQHQEHDENHPEDARATGGKLVDLGRELGGFGVRQRGDARLHRRRAYALGLELRLHIRALQESDDALAVKQLLRGDHAGVHRQRQDERYDQQAGDEAAEHGELLSDWCWSMNSLAREVLDFWFGEGAEYGKA